MTQILTPEEFEHRFRRPRRIGAPEWLSIRWTDFQAIRESHEALRQQLAEADYALFTLAKAYPVGYRCVDCGGNFIPVDEDECCTMCGRDAIPKLLVEIFPAVQRVLGQQSKEDEKVSL